MENSSGLSFAGLLTIVFITLKLTGVINWSWWLVLLPFYGPILGVILVFGIIILLSMLRK